MQAQIRVQALAIKFLEEENRKQAERIAALEALLYCQGILDKDAVLTDDGMKTWYADLMIDRYKDVEVEA